MKAPMICDVRAVADAVLYEGYILYPYRKSSIKNRQRWTFGGLFPGAYVRRGGGDRAAMICECLVRGDEDARIALQLRFLRVAVRRVARLVQPARLLALDALPPHRIVEGMEIGGRSYLPWDEAAPQEEQVEAARLGDLLARPLTREFHYPAASEPEAVAGADGLVEGLILRQSEDVRARLVLSAQKLEGGVCRLTARIENTTVMETPPGMKRDVAALHSLASTHLVLTLKGGAFISLTDPPDEWAAAARSCVNEGCWPVLAGADGATDCMLAAPIILYDYPRIAPESRSDLFDGTEIDEILILRILTMTDAEKREMALGDPKAAALLKNLESMTSDEMGKLHGAWRGGKPELAASNGFCVGARVRLKPRAGGDILDIALAGKTAVIEAIERDFEDRTHIAVVVEDDPGRDFGTGRFPGHRFFFSPEEVEPVSTP